jgi:DNA-binding transcriptional ArsR family regulator
VHINRKGLIVDSEAQFFKVLADPTRLRLAILLAIKGEVCVCELAGALGEPQYKVSRHLGIMRAEDMVKVRREGTWMHYRLRDPASELERCLFDCFRDCLKTHAVVQDDLKRLKKGSCCK